MRDRHAARDSARSRGHSARVLQALLITAVLQLALNQAAGATGDLPRGGVSGELPRDGAVVARIGLDAPPAGRRLVRATLPVPPAAGERLLRATAGLLLRGNDPARTTQAAQVEVVSRAPDGRPDVVEVCAPLEVPAGLQTGRAMELELLWSAAAPAVEAGRPSLPASLVAPALATGGGAEARASLPRFALRAQDGRGHRYWADLAPESRDASHGATRALADGSWRRSWRVASVLVPREPVAGSEPLPHLMGVHAYLEANALDGVVALDLRVHNGLVTPPGRTAEGPPDVALGALYFRALELVVPRGWIVEPELKDPFWGEPYDEGELRVFPIVAPLPGGRVHLIGPQGQFERRLALAPFGERSAARARLDRVGLAFAQPGQGLWSWWNPATAHYFAARDLLATLGAARLGELTGRRALRAAHAGEVAALERGLTSGTAQGWYVTSGVLGWAHPWFVKEAGGVGGEGIATLEGHEVAYAASRAGYRQLELLHRMNVCRQPEAAYDGRGEVVGYHALLGSEGKIPFDFRTNGGIVFPAFRLPCQWGLPPNADVLHGIAAGLRPPYDQGNWYEPGGNVGDSPASLLAWWPHDDQHLIRYTKNTKALVWLGNDALARDDLLLSAELYRLMRHESPHVAADWSIGVTLRVWEEIVKKHPHQGLWFGREDGWGIDAMCAAYSVASPEWRARQRPWFDRMSQLLLDASLPNGLLQRMVNERLLDTQLAVAQTFECFFLMHALRCMNESVFRGVDDRRRRELEQLLLRGLDYLMWGPPWARIPNDWQPDPAHPTLFLQGPRQGIAIAKNDDYATPPFSDVARWGANYLPPGGLGGGVEFFHPWQALAYAADATQSTHGAGKDNRYLRRALDCWTPHADFQALLNDLWTQRNDPSLDNSANWIGLAGRLQALGFE